MLSSSKSIYILFAEIDSGLIFTFAVCLFVCYLAALHKNCSINYHETRSKDVVRVRRESAKLWFFNIFLDLSEDNFKDLIGKKCLMFKGQIFIGRVQVGAGPNTNLGLVNLTVI